MIYGRSCHAMRRKGIKSVLKTAKLTNFEMMMTGNKKQKQKCKVFRSQQQNIQGKSLGREIPLESNKLSCSIFLQITSKHFILNSTRISMEVNPLQTLSHHGMIISIDVLCTLIIIYLMCSQNRKSVFRFNSWSVDSW